MKYQILDENGAVINTIEASLAFVEANYPGRFVEVPEPPAPPATPRTRLTRLEFRNQFTMAEKQALYTAAQSSVDIQIFLDDVNAAEYVETTDQLTIDGLGALVSEGLLTQARADEILLGILDS